MAIFKQKIFDCFIYNNENDLLKIRLNYLAKHVDYFIIVESCQTFQGDKKKFNFLSNKSLIKKYKKKIIYFQNKNIFKNTKTLEKLLKKKYPKIFSYLNDLDNFNKNDLTWYLDSFHREILQIPIQKWVQKKDIIILSDLDEIPNVNTLKKIKIKKINVFLQNEYRYFLNSLVRKNWPGTIIMTRENMEKYGLNKLKMLAKKKFKAFKYIFNGGYHFSFVGNYDHILSKINSWSHSEYNNFLIKFFLKKRFFKGLDISFMIKNQFRLISVDNKKYFDEKMRNIFIQNNDLIKRNDYQKKTILDDLVFYIVRFLLLFFKAKRKLFNK